MIHYLLLHWITWAIILGACGIALWLCWEMIHAPVDPEDTPPPTHDEGIMGDVLHPKNDIQCQTIKLQKTL